MTSFTPSDSLRWFPQIIAATVREFKGGAWAPKNVPTTADILRENMYQRYDELLRKERLGTLTEDESTFMTMYVNANTCRAQAVEIAVMSAQLGRDLTKNRNEKRDFLQNLHLMVLGDKAGSDLELDLFLEDYGEVVLPGIENYRNVIRMDFENYEHNQHDP